MSITQYFKDTRLEMKHVSWPTRKQAIAYSILIISVSLITAFFLGFLDYLFAYILGILVG